MADKKISELTAVTDIVSGDEYVLARAGASKKIDVDDMAAGIAALYPPGGSASDVAITDTGGYFTGTDVEAALQELGAGGGGGGGGTPWNQQFLCGLGFVQLAGTWTLTLNTSFAGLCSVQSDGNNGSEVAWKVSLDAGTYDLVVIGQTSSNRAIQNFKLNGSSVGTWDAYDAGGANNFVNTETGITVATSGVYTFSILADGKNGSSSAYYIVNHMFMWLRTA